MLVLVGGDNLWCGVWTRFGGSRMWFCKFSEMFLDIVGVCGKFVGDLWGDFGYWGDWS
jgi:hypothetical protein